MIFHVGPGQSLVLVLFLSLGVTAGPVGSFDEELAQAFQDIVESTGGASDEGGGLQRSHLSVLFHDISTLFKNVANILRTDRAPSGDETGEGEDDTEEIGERQEEGLEEDGEHEGEEIEQEEEQGEDGEQEDEEIEWEDTDDEDVELEEDVEQEEAEIERQEEDVELEEKGEQVEEEVQWEDNDAEDVELGEDGEQEEEEVEREDKDAEYVELAEDVEQEEEVVQWEDKDVEDVALGNVEEDGPDEEPDNAGQFFDEWTRRNFWLNRPRPHATPQDVIEASRQREQEGQQREQQTLKEREREQQMLEEQQQEHQMLEERQHEQQMLEEPEHEQQILDELEPQHEQQILDEDNRLSSGGIDQSTANDKATVGEIAATNVIQPFEGSDGNQDHQPDEEPDNAEQEAGQGGIAVNQDQGQGGQIFDEWTRRNFWREQEQQMLEERVREQQMLEERQQEQRLLEERLREQQSAEERRQEQQMLEERERERQMLEEQQREQQLLEEREREQQMLEERQQEQQMLEERQQEQQMLEERQPGANDVSATDDIGQPGDTGGEGSSVDENHHPPNEVDQSTVNDEAAVEENNDLPPLGASGNHRPEPIASDEATGELASAPGDTSLPGGTKQWSPFDENVATMGKGGPSITIQRPTIHNGQNDDEASDEEGNSPFSGPWSPFTKNAPSFGKHPPHDHAHGPSSSGSAVGGAESQQARWADLIHNMRKPNADPFRGKWSPFDENPPPFGRNPGSIG
ncbi:probable serine/threonine-protein kinase kinX [Branchiostoma floridae]|uniref:Probable serine/threonine-protein kinase kinX n=1 Tax=Branchiostoma floridae TaxID=7739 RepID=A0A9J7HIV8_BRAFL|nr:probable serine/threonine-protein kinase kinX [Branchiostoma floridae]